MPDQRTGEENSEIQTEAVFAGENLFAAYPIVHSLRKKHIPVLTLVQKDGKKLIMRIPSGS